MENSLLIFTSNMDGGIAQFAIKLSHTLLKSVDKIMLMVPEGFKYEIAEDLPGIHWIKYRKIKTLNIYAKGLTEIANTIMDLKPQVVLYADSTIPSMQVANLLGNKKRQAIVVHDVTPHLSHFKPINFFKSLYQLNTFKRSLRVFELVILLSKNNARVFKLKYSQYEGKSIVIPLGAHLIVPKKEEKKASIDLMIERDYLLFFGRLDKYKGIGTLLEAYALDKANKLPKLIIAGKGILSSAESSLIEELTNKVTLINKYIEEDEMVKLFTNAKAVVLPYIEASQSGVLPIAYQLGKPVVASDLPGLSEFIEDRKTGLIFKVKDSKDLYSCLSEITSADLNYDEMSRNTVEYYHVNLDWNNNVNKLLEALRSD